MMRRSSVMGLVVFAILAASSCLAALAFADAGSPAAAKKKSRSHRVIVSPRPGARVAGHPLRIVVRADHRLRDLGVRLNGRRIGAEFGPSRKGLRVAYVGASHGLRYGLNVLRVRARQPNRHWRKATVRFRVVHRRPLAGAGFDRRIHARQRIRLNGLGSINGIGAPGAPRRGRRAHLRYRWRLVRAPRASLFDPGQPVPPGARKGGRSAWAPKLAGLRSPRPTFTPDVPGTYVFKLTVTNGRYKSSDRVAIEVAPRSWLVPLQTMATQGGQEGIQVGGRFYAGSGPGDESRCLVQLLVLSRATLGEAVNKTFGYSGCGADPSPDANAAGRVASYLKTLNDSKLVIAVSQPGFAAPLFLRQALARIGLRWGNSAYGSPREIGSSIDPGTGGRISVIGVPGIGSGEAQVHTVYNDDQPEDASLDGYLGPDQYLNFKFIPKQRVAFDTGAGGEAPGAATNTIEVGDQKYAASLPAGAHGGYQVLILDRTTLRPRAPQQVFAVSDTQSAAQGYQALRAMQSYITGNAREHDLLFVVSLGKPSAHLESWQVAPALSELAGLIGWDGGSRNNFVFALRNHVPYLLVGTGAATQLHGEEVVGFGGAAARLRGTLATNELSLFAPRDASSLSDPSDPLIEEVLKPPSSEWPLDGNPQAKAALSYIGTQTTPELGPDPRSAFVNKVNWSTIIGQVRAMSYPGPGHGFCDGVAVGQECKPFIAAKQELIAEMQDVDNVRTYLANISQPFAENGLTSWASLQSIADQIQRAAEVKPKDTVLTLALDIAGGILDVIPLAIPEAYAVVRVISEVVAISYATAIEYWSQTREGESDDELRTTADRLGLEMAERFKDAAIDIEHMGNVIVTDPKKLAYVGAVANCNPVHNDRCPMEWAWTDDVKTAASAALARGTEAGFYQELLPIAFPSYRLVPNPGSVNRESSADVQWPGIPSSDHFYCGDFGRNRPFANRGNYGFLVVNNATDIPQSPSRSTEGFEPYTAYAIGAKANVDAAHPSPAAAPQAILNRMFSAVDPGNNPRLGGLGINWGDYMQRTSTTYGPKDPFGSNCGWN
jgi:hypothetical protein